MCDGSVAKVVLVFECTKVGLEFMLKKGLAWFQGQLANGQEIAIKRMSKNSTQGIEEFKNEVMLIVIYFCLFFEKKNDILIISLIGEAWARIKIVL